MREKCLFARGSIWGSNGYLMDNSDKIKSLQVGTFFAEYSGGTAGARLAFLESPKARVLNRALGRHAVVDHTVWIDTVEWKKEDLV